MRLAVMSTLLALAAIHAGCGEDGAPTASTPTPLARAESGMLVIPLRHDAHELLVEVASTPEQRAVGLSNREAVAPDTGMLFDLGETRVPRFWMKDTLVALDMVWIREDRVIAEITADVQPQPGVPDSELAMYAPSSLVRYVLELPAGAAEQLGMKPGDALDFALP